MGAVQLLSITVAKGSDSFRSTTQDVRKMAHIEDRRDEGKGWGVRYRAPDHRERNKSFARKIDAERFLVSIEHAKLRGEWVDPDLGNTRFGDYAAAWVETKGNVRPRTRINVEGRLRNHILPYFGSMRLTLIRPSDVRAWIKELSDARLAPSTVKASYLTFGQIMRTAEIHGFVRRSPCVGIELPADVSTEEMHFLTPTQVAQLADAITPRFSAAILTAAYTGMRAGELWALKHSRMNLLRRTIDVVESLVEIGGRITVGPTKTRARRTLTLPRFLAEILAEHVRAYPSSEGYVFSSKEGGPVRHRNFYARHFRRAVNAAGLPGSLRFHDLRHTCASILIAQGWNHKQIQMRLGHATIRTTLDRYGHLFDEHDAALLEGLDGVYRASLAALTRPQDGPVLSLDAMQGAQ
jgi:integrase